MRSRPRLPLQVIVAWLFLTHCGRSPEAPSGGTPSEPKPPPTEAAKAAEAPSAAAPPASAAASAASAAKAWSREAYPWLAEASTDAPAAVEALRARFAPPAGFVRVEPAAGSFGAWLRDLPLAAVGTPVRTFRGDVLHDASHPKIAAVVAIDIGKGDLQQCADSVMRLHGEWLWSQGRRDQVYRAASGTPMPFARWARGERVVAQGNQLGWQLSGKPSESHGTFRAYLDAVFNWANTVALARDAARVPSAAQLRAGDFFVLPGNPGHAVLILDLAQHPDGRRVAILGQGYMPAQSFHIVRRDNSSDDQPWFALDGDGVLTPFWPDAFPWSSLRRLD